MDLLDVRESLEQVGDVARWIPIEQIMYDRLAKRMPTDMLTSYLEDMTDALTHGHHNKATTRDFADVCTALREPTQEFDEGQRVPQKPANFVGGTFTFLAQPQLVMSGRFIDIPMWEYHITTHGYRKTHTHYVDKLCKRGFEAAD